MQKLKKIQWGLTLLCLLIFFAGCGAQKEQAQNQEKPVREITDQLGRKVTIPAHPQRIVCLQHHSLDILLELQAGDKLVGVVDKWENLVSPELGEIYPRLKELPTPGDLKTVNIEALSKLQPDVVLVTHYMDKGLIEKIEKMGIPVVAISLYKAEYEEASKLNPKLKDPDKAYTEGFIEGVKLLGDIVEKPEKAQELIDYTLQNRKMVEERLAAVSTNAQPVRVYMANPDMYTYGTGKYMGVMMKRAGVENVAENVNGYAQVTMEQILTWNPAVIFVQSRYSGLADEIRSNPAWKNIDALQKGAVLIAPEYTKPWGHPCPESMALGELWMAKTFHPEAFQDIQMQEKVNEFYQKFYGVPYKG